jgi:hypothetical protein
MFKRTPGEQQAYVDGMQMALDMIENRGLSDGKLVINGFITIARDMMEREGELYPGGMGPVDMERPQKGTHCAACAGHVPIHDTWCYLS